MSKREKLETELEVANKKVEEAWARVLHYTEKSRQGFEYVSVGREIRKNLNNAQKDYDLAMDEKYKIIAKLRKVEQN